MTLSSHISAIQFTDRNNLCTLTKVNKLLFLHGESFHCDPSNTFLCPPYYPKMSHPNYTSSFNDILLSFVTYIYFSNVYTL